LATQDRADRSAVKQVEVHRGAHSFTPRRLSPSLTNRGLKAALTTAATVALVSTMIAVLPAAADPGDSGSTSSSSVVAPQPSTASEAKQAWLDAATKSEAANEALLQAQDAEKKAQQDVADAKVALTQATLNASTTQAAAVQAAAEYAAYRDDLADFASASFRGARFGQLAALLTAKTTTEYLDELASLNQVAGSTRILLDQAFAAKDAADAASDAADDAAEAATDAARKADEALAAATAATKKVTEQKADLEQQAETYHRLFSALSGQERAAAMRSQQAAWEQQALSAQAQQGSEDQISGQVRAAAEGSAESADTSAAIGEAGPKAQIAVKAALSTLGLPYRYGASGPNAYDCSGLTSWAWAQAGVSLPRTSAGQSTLPVVPLDQLRVGDLITYYSPVHHVAMYIGNGQIIHASTEGVPVYITSMYRGGPYPVGHRVNY
jgi:cell wall-associated NlpC family hydrolase